MMNHRRTFPMVEARLHAGRVIFLWKMGNTAATKVLRREHDRGQGRFVGGYRNPPLARQGQIMCHHRRNALMVTAGAERVTCS